MSSRNLFKCLHCNEMCRAEKRNAWHQKFCAKPDCRKASKAESQRRWLSQPKSRDYFRGSANVQRVREWREAHPGYWRRGRKRSPAALQDVVDSKSPVPQPVTKSPLEHALQDLVPTQVPLVVGLLSLVTGCALQDDIAASARQMIAKGQMILGKGPGIEPKGVCAH